MFSLKSVTKATLAVLLSLTSATLVSLIVSGSAAAMLVSESPLGAIVALPPFAVQSTAGVTDTTVADFLAGTGDCYVAPSAGNDLDGELMLTPTVGTDFSGSVLPTGWYSGTYVVTGTAEMGSGVITVAGAYVGTSAVYSPGQTLEFSATFGAVSEHVGLADSTDLNSGSWAIFSTATDGSQLYARTATTSSPLGAGYLNSGHRYKIEWTGTSVIYSIDGTAVVTHTSPQLTNSMRPLISSLNANNDLVVNWLRMSPYATSCSFQSRVLNAGQSAHWTDANSASLQPAGSTIAEFQTRSGRVPSPDGTWSAWSPISGTAINNPNGQYIQYRVQLSTTNAMFAPALLTVTLSFTPAGQTIAFDPLPDRTYGDPPFTVVATATSSLPVTFTTSGTCTNTGITVTLTSAGSCAVSAHQAGNALYDPAPDVTRTFTIAQASQAITFAPLPDRTYGDPAFTAVATATSNLPVAFTTSGTCTNTGATVSIISAGTCAVAAHQPGNVNYLPALDVTRTFTIAQASQAITFAPLPDRTYGDPAFTAVATATSSLPVAFTTSGTCTNTGATVSIISAGTCAVAAHQPGNVNYLPALDVTRTFTIAQATPSIIWSNPADIVFGTALSATQLNAGVSVSGTLVYSPATGTVLNAGPNQLLRVDFTPDDTINYTLTTKAVAITVTQASQAITFAPLPDKVIGDPAFTVVATATSSLPVTFMANGDCSVAGNTVTLVKAGSCTVTAQQAGNINYAAAPDVPRTFTIAPAKIYLPLIMRLAP
jgi:hypothetical protein